MRQLNVNNLHTVITRLNPVDRARFEPGRQAQRADSMYICSKIYIEPSSEFISSTKLRMSRIVGSYKKFCLNSRTETIQKCGGIRMSDGSLFQAI